MRSYFIPANFYRVHKVSQTQYSSFFEYFLTEVSEQSDEVCSYNHFPLKQMAKGSMGGFYRICPSVQVP